MMVVMFACFFFVSVLVVRVSAVVAVVSEVIMFLLSLLLW